MELSVNNGHSVIFGLKEIPKNGLSFTVDYTESVISPQ